MYIYQTPLCIWVIRPVGHNWRLEWHIDGDFQISGHYANPVLAADDVASQSTGFDTWDLTHTAPPEIENISNWQWVALGKPPA